MKSKGEYLSELSSINGFYQLRPYISAALMIFMFSLIGMAPTLGFFGYLSVINNLMSTLSWGKIILLMSTLLFVAGACLQIIRTIYFEPLTNKYDRTDKAIYICLFINMAILVISLINPIWLMQDILIILGRME
jgi:NADH-quinone oxidoreductase subunit N